MKQCQEICMVRWGRVDGLQFYLPSVHCGYKS